MKNLSYKQYLTESEKFRQALTLYIQSKDYTVEHKEISYQILDAIDKKSKNDVNCRNEAYRYYTCHPNYKTIKLREICNKAGYDYWNTRNQNKLDVSNAIDTIDTAHVYFGVEKVKQSFTLQKLTEYKDIDNQIVFSGGYPSINPGHFVEEKLQKEGYNLTMTQLYRINFKDSETCTTWEGADLEPRIVDILALELNFQYVTIIADLGDATMQIALDLRENNLVIAPVYLNFDWIKEVSYAQLEAICEAVAAKFEDSKNEFKEAINRLKP